MTHKDDLLKRIETIRAVFDAQERKAKVEIAKIESIAKAEEDKEADLEHEAAALRSVQEQTAKRVNEAEKKNQEAKKALAALKKAKEDAKKKNQKALQMMKKAKETSDIEAGLQKRRAATLNQVSERQLKTILTTKGDSNKNSFSLDDKKIMALPNSARIPKGKSIKLARDMKAARKMDPVPEAALAAESNDDFNLEKRFESIMDYLNHDEMQSVRAAFEYIDFDQSGDLSLGELRSLDGVKVTQSEYEGLDTNNDGVISLMELLQLIQPKLFSTYEALVRVHAVFQTLDADKDGGLDIAELMTVLPEISSAQIKEYDTNDSGSLSLLEVVSMLHENDSFEKNVPLLKKLAPLEGTMKRSEDTTIQLSPNLFGSKPAGASHNLLNQRLNNNFQALKKTFGQDNHLSNHLSNRLAEHVRGNAAKASEHIKAITERNDALIDELTF